MPKRGLGDATVQMLHDHARKRRIPLFEAARAVVETDELKPKARGSLRNLIARSIAGASSARSLRTPSWPKSCSTRAATPRCGKRTVRRTPPAGSTTSRSWCARWRNSKTCKVFEHISLVMDRDGGADDEAVSLMTLHSAKGLEFDNVFLPGWEEGLFPSQRTLDEQGRAGLEEERRLAHVGLTGAPARKTLFCHQPPDPRHLVDHDPSRFLDELPAHNVEITKSKGGSGWGGTSGYGPSRFDNVESFGSSYSTPGWQRAQAQRARGQGGQGGGKRQGQARGGFNENQSPFSSRDDTWRFCRSRRGPMVIEGELIAKSTGTISEFSLGRPRISPEIRLRPRRQGRRQQADHRVRKGRREESRRQFRAAGLGRQPSN